MRNAILQYVFFLGMVEIPRKNAHRLADSACQTVLNLLEAIGVDYPESLRRGFGLKRGERVSGFVRRVWEAEGKPPFPRTRAEAEDLRSVWGF